MPEDYISVRQAAERLGIDGATIRKWCAAGKIPGAKKLNERAWIIPEKAIIGLRRSNSGRKPKK